MAARRYRDFRELDREAILEGRHQQHGRRRSS